MFAAETNGAGPAWGSVGLDVLATTAMALGRYNRRVELCQGHEPELRRARSLAREVNSLLTTNAGLGLTGDTNDDGVLDREEHLRVNQLIRQRSGRTAKSF